MRKSKKDDGAQLFYHHVGVNGSVDFDKTVFKDIHISLLSEALSEDIRESVIDDIESRFSSHRFNCWGVPADAGSVLKHLAVDDYVLLVQSTGKNGKVVALCQVMYRLEAEQPALSKTLWGKTNYPLIFFFKTEKLDLPWTDFRKHLGYRERYNPRGRFFKVAKDRFEHLNGIEAYIQNLRKRYLVKL